MIPARLWTDEEILTLMVAYDHGGADEAVKVLDRSRAAIVVKASQLGLRTPRAVYVAGRRLTFLNRQRQAQETS